MLCPKCKSEVLADRKYCDICGLEINLDDLVVERTFAEEADLRFKKQTLDRCYRYFLSAAFLLYVAICVRLVVDFPKPLEGVGPTYLLNTPPLPIIPQRDVDQIRVELPPN